MDIAEQQTNNVSQQRLKIRKTLENEDEEEDRISALHDCLIVHILSLLPSTIDAIKTGTLSKRWKSLWTLIPYLIFEDFVFNCPTSDFVSFVDKTLTQCRHSKLKKFRLSIGYDFRFEAQINSWIRYAMSCNVEELSLSLYDFDSEDKCVLEDQFFKSSCFTDLKLENCMFNPNGAISWSMLRILCISYANLDEDLIENILRGSPILETLELTTCYGYKRLDISSKSVKNLVFCGYYSNDDDFYHDDVIEINAPNILSLKIRSDLVLWKLLLVDVSSLVEAELDYTKLGYYETTTKKEGKEELLKGLVQSLYHVKELKVGILCSMVVSRLEAKGFIFPPTTKFLYGIPVASSDSDSLDEDDNYDGDLVKSEDL